LFATALFLSAQDESVLERISRFRIARPNPPQEEIEAHYKENITKYDSFKVERIIIPRCLP
jgi:hypothetical protein